MIPPEAGLTSLRQQPLQLPALRRRGILQSQLAGATARIDAQQRRAIQLPSAPPAAFQATSTPPGRAVTQGWNSLANRMFISAKPPGQQNWNAAIS